MAAICRARRWLTGSLGAVGCHEAFAEWLAETLIAHAVDRKQCHCPRKACPRKRGKTLCSMTLPSLQQRDKTSARQASAKRSETKEAMHQTFSLQLSFTPIGRATHDEQVA